MYKLELPESLKIHPVFHVSTLRPYTDPASVEHQPPPSLPPDPISINDHEEFEVECILDHRTHRHQSEYLVKWLGYPDYDASWEPAAHLEHASDVVRDFWTSGSKSQGERGVM